MSTFDIILGMDWLSMFGAIIDCDRRRVTLCPEPGMTVHFLADRELSSSVVNPVRGIFDCLLASLSLSDTEGAIPALPPIVSEYMDVFHEDVTPQNFYPMIYI